ncbi:MAG: hemolysin III family protein [Rhodobacteraceae bacterium]|nr:hemolysin III family protein [Paracoccaceae bacterium]
MGRIGTRIGGYSRAEKLSDAVVHVAGLASALMAVPVLVTLTAFWRGDAPALFGVAIYGAALIGMILCSALYHMVPHPQWKGLLRRLDHSAIYLKIAGTYTPFAFLSGVGAGLVTGLWSAALAGIALWIFAPGRFRWLAFSLYLGMGWVGLVLGWPLFSTMSWPVLGLVIAGGVTYTVGTAFYLLEAIPFHNTIWHVFVLAASVVFFVAVTLHLAETSALIQVDVQAPAAAHS